LQMIDTLGQASSEMFVKWSRRTRYFDKDLKLIRSDVGSSDITEREPYQGPSLEEAFEESRPDGMGVEECIHVLGLLRRLLQYEPALRPSTAELPEDKWFQSITQHSRGLHLASQNRQWSTSAFHFIVANEDLAPHDSLSFCPVGNNRSLLQLDTNRSARAPS
jgi:hypothetical protein